jgi:hypothetical protein
MVVVGDTHKVHGFDGLGDAGRDLEQYQRTMPTIMIAEKGAAITKGAARQGPRQSESQGGELQRNGTR